MKRVSRNNITIATVLRACVLALLAVVATSAYAKTEILDRVVAVVDDDVILASELHDRMQQAISNLQKQNPNKPLPPMKELQREVLDHMIVENLELQMGHRAGVRISDQQLNQAMAQIAQQNGMTLDQFRDALGKHGMSYQKTREQVRKEMIIQQVQAGNLNSKVQVTDQEVDNFLKTPEGKELVAPRYHIVHLFYPLAADATDAQIEAAKKLIAGAAAKIRGGESMQAWLSQYQAKHPKSSIKGGDLGWRKVDDLPSVFSAVVPKLSEGQVSDPISNPGGIHLVQLVGEHGGTRIVEQTHARHILIKPSEIRSDEQAKALLEKLRQQVGKGANFGDLAREYSDDIGTAQEGGDLGWSEKGQFVPSFQKAMDNTPVGGVSEPFQTRYGWHIVQVLGRRKHDISKELAHQQAYNYLFHKKFQEELQAWLQKIRDEAYVDIKLGNS